MTGDVIIIITIHVDDGASKFFSDVGKLIPDFMVLHEQESDFHKCVSYKYGVPKTRDQGGYVWNVPAARKWQHMRSRS